MDQLNSIEVSEIPELLTIAKKADIVVNLIGTQGIGKSESVRQYQNMDGFESLIDIRLGQLEAGDFTGLPRVRGIRVDNEVRYTTIYGTPCWWPKSGKHIIFLDEWNRASTIDVIQAIFQLLLEKRIHTNILPEGCQIVLAMNPDDSHKFMVHKLNDLSLMDRIMHINVTHSTRGWTDWAHKSGVDRRIINFVEKEPKALGSSLFTGYRRIPSPRSMEMVSKILKVATTGELMKFGMQMFSGLIGTEMAVPLIKFLGEFEDIPIGGIELLTNYPKYTPILDRWMSPDKMCIDALNSTLMNIIREYANHEYEKFTKEEVSAYKDLLLRVPKDVTVAHLRECVNSDTGEGFNRMFFEAVSSVDENGKSISDYLKEVVTPEKEKGKESAAK